MADPGVTDESGLLRALIQAAVRAQLAVKALSPVWGDQVAREVADEVIQALGQANVSVVQLHALGPREEE